MYSSTSTPPSTPTSTSTAESKFSKLSLEYAKLRAQFGVVKKAVIEEQAKNADIGDKMRESNMDRRRMEMELDAVTFRNQQLTKRIHVLQEEMDVGVGGGGGGGKKAARNKSEAVQNSESLNSVIGQELAAKIDENERLHARLSTVDAKYDEVINKLNSRIRELEAEVRRKSQEDRAEDSKQKELINGLKTDNVALMKKAEELDHELIDHQDRITVLQVQLESKDASPTSTGPITTSSSGTGDSGGSKFPLTSDDARIQSVQLLSQFGEGVTDFVAALSDFHTYWEHRLKDTGGGHNADQLSKVLLPNVQYLKPVEEAFQTLLSKVLSGDGGDGSIFSHLAPFATNFKAYVDYASSMETLTIACLQDENDNYSCPPSQQEKNGQFMASLTTMNEAMSKVAEQLSAFCSEQLGDDDALAGIVAAASQLSRQVRQIANCYSEKAVDENHLPTVTEQLKATNQCIVAALASMLSSVDALERLLCDNRRRISMLIRVGKDAGLLVAPPPLVNDTAKDEVVANDKEDAAREALLEEVQRVKEEKMEISKVIEELNEKTKKLEQGREHWKLEFQLLQMKYEKAKLEKGEQNDGDQSQEEAEDLLKKPYVARIESMVSERLFADSKASTYYLECVSLQKRIRSAERRKARCEDDLKLAMEQVDLLKEENETTANSYDGQLRMMSEHVANMNEKLSSQTDEIQSLKYELLNKRKK